MKKILVAIATTVTITLITMCFIVSMKESTTDTSYKQLTTKEKIEDFEYMYKIIKEGYPFLQVNKRLNDIDWEANKEIYRKRIKNTKTDEEFVEAMSLIVSDLNSGHAEVIDDENIYKVYRDILIGNGWYDFWDDEKVVNRYKRIGSTFNNIEDIIPEKDILVKDVILGEVGYMHIPQMKSDYESRKKDMKVIGDYIKTLDNHRALIIDIRGNMGGDDSYWESIVSKLIDEDMTRTGYMLFREDNDVITNYMDKRIDKNTLYRINKLPKKVMKNAPSETLDMFTSFSKANFKIDASSEDKFEGNIYLLVDNTVFSSAEAFAIFCKDTGFATIVGERTAGDGGGIDPVLFNLENSGLIVKMTSQMFLTGTGICNEEFKTTPDYKVSNCEITLDWKDDKCIGKVLELENIR